jgi:hypothetical protein
LLGSPRRRAYANRPAHDEDTEAGLDAGRESAAISLDREVFEGAIAHEVGALTLQLGGVELLIARRE